MAAKFECEYKSQLAVATMFCNVWQCFVVFVMFYNVCDVLFRKCLFADSLGASNAAWQRSREETQCSPHMGAALIVCINWSL